MMDTSLTRKYLHDLSNALNAAKINAYLLRRIHGDVLDKESMTGLDGALRDAEELVAEFHEKVHQELRTTPAPSTDPLQLPSPTHP